ncbi:MAG: ribose-5-phosphate isomerase RpiA [Alphaproteobacteria bacterium]|nr:ribose-5-phosphate isomerase RpiA [Alphaproteobacteria bacterium]
MEFRDRLKQAAAAHALDFVEDGMVLGLGTGSTAAFFVEQLADRVAGGLVVRAVATSERTAAQARRLGIPLTNFAEHRQIDLAIDGADEVQRSTLDLIKGRGGALLREKIVAAASRRFIVIVDGDKLVDRLGTTGPLPVEVVQFGWQVTEAALKELGACTELRRAASGESFVSDGGNFILDCRFGPIADPADTERRINSIIGVVENGLFVGRSSAVVVASPEGVKVLTRNGAAPQ